MSATPMNRATMSEQLTPGLDMIIDQNYDAITEDHKELFEVRTSNKQYEEHLMLGSFGEAFTKEEGASVKYDTITELYKAKYVHQTVALGFSITEEAMDDNVYDTHAKLRAQGLGRAMAQTKQTRAAAVYNNAFTTANGPQGQTMISANHPTMRGNGTPFSNKLSGDLSESSLEAALIQISRQRDDRGNFTNATPTKLIIPAGLQFQAFRILKSDLSTTPTVINGTGVAAANDTNALKGKGMFQNGVHVCRRLLDDDAWFILTDVPNGPVMYQRKPVSTRDNLDENKMIYFYVASERYSFGWTDFRAIYGSDGTSD